MEVAIGIDPAKNSLAVAAVDALGKCLAQPISNDSKGHRALLRWVGKRGRDRVIGIECAAGTEPGFEAAARMRTGRPGGPEHVDPP